MHAHVWVWGCFCCLLNKGLLGSPSFLPPIPEGDPATHLVGFFLQVKEAAERALQAKNLSLDVSIECLTLRESRRAIDVVRDAVEEELHREVKVIEKAKRELQQRVSEAFEQLW